MLAAHLNLCDVQNIPIDVQDASYGKVPPRFENLAYSFLFIGIDPISWAYNGMKTMMS